MGRWSSVCLIGAIILVAGIVCIDCDDSEGSSDYTTFYCYGNTVYGFYPGSDLNEVTVKWDVQDINGTKVHYETVSKGRIQVDASQYDWLLLIQTVEGSNGASDTDETAVIPLHMDSSEVVKVEFIDGGQVVQTNEITSTKVVLKGENHVHPPNVSNRIGETFMGWFVDEELTIPFDPKEPILEDTKVYSSWIASPGPGGSIEVYDKIITFNTIPGLGYEITDLGKITDDGSSMEICWITFDVFPVDGCMFREGSITVKANDLPIEGTNGSYRIECITDVDVTITGDRMYSITYDMTNTSVSVNGYTTPPSMFPDGGIVAAISIDKNCSNLTIKVFSDGRDITNSCVSGNIITLNSTNGNILILASADSDSGFPLWIIVVVIAILALAAVIIYRNNVTGKEKP